MATASSWHGTAGDEMRCTRGSETKVKKCLAHCCHVNVNCSTRYCIFRDPMRTAKRNRDKGFQGKAVLLT